MTNYFIANKPIILEDKSLEYSNNTHDCRANSFLENCKEYIKS